MKNQRADIAPQLQPRVAPYALPDGASRGLWGDLSLAQFAIVVAYAIFMLGVCLLACVVPTRRALSVEPTVALRLD